MTDPVPQRIGDADRDRAVEYLREHLAQGRLSQEEFDERIGTALSARTATDIEPLFADLPAPRPGGSLPAVSTPQAWPAYSPPGSEVAARPAAPLATPQRPPTALAIAAAVAWPAWILLMFATNWQYVWLVFIPIMISSITGKLYGDRQRDRQRHRRGE